MLETLGREQNPPRRHITESANVDGGSITAKTSQTVIRRTRRQKADGILASIDGLSLSPTHAINAIYNVITGSSTLVGTSTSPNGPSMSPTLIEFTENCVQSELTNVLSPSDVLRNAQKGADRISSTVPNPSIVTVEATANAKAFLEVRFNEIFSHNKQSQREARHVELETRLSSALLSDRVQDAQRQRWLELETNYLRSIRVSQAREFSGRQGGTHASKDVYSFCKVLGKGSFGVVRLAVRRPLPTGLGSSNSYKNGLGCDRLGQSTCQPWDVCAVKIIKKSEMLRNTQEAHIKAERDVLTAATRSRWIVSLIESFQDQSHLYLAMEYMAGGDFLAFLVRWDKLEEQCARFYIAEMILCVEEAHRLGYIHRDVKPDNFLISSNGHLKISDFGLAFDGHWSHDQGYYNYQRHSLLDRLGIKVSESTTNLEQSTERVVNEKHKSALFRHRYPSNDDQLEISPLLHHRNSHGMRNLARSVVGTSQYMAPEVIRGDDYDGRCDWWSIGIILFECLYGETPFLGKDRQETKANVTNFIGDMHFVPNSYLGSYYQVSRDAKDLINRLLKNKESRLSCRAYLCNDMTQLNVTQQLGDICKPDAPFNRRTRFLYRDDASDIKAHPFFAGVDWDRLHLSSPPDIPFIRHGLDTRYFDQCSINDCSTLSPYSTLDTPQADINQNRSIPPSTGKAGPENLFTFAKLHCPTFPPKPAQRRIKAPKRPRDAILRDANLARRALEKRKAGSFLGYTYQRPTELLSFLESISDGSWSN